jgi:hypothetical protein
LTCFEGGSINHTLVAVLTGVVTSERIGRRCGDASFEGGDRRLSRLFTPHAEAERLGLREGRKTLSGDADKNAVAL